MVAWYLSGWCGCVHAYGYGHPTELVPAPCLQIHFDISCIRTCKALTKMSLQIERCVRLLDQRLCNMLIMLFENAEDSFHLIGMIGLHVNAENERLEQNRVVVDLKFACCPTASKLCAQMVAITLVLLWLFHYFVFFMLSFYFIICFKLTNHIIDRWRYRCRRLLLKLGSTV